MNNDVDNDQKKLQDENIESQALGEFTLDAKEQIIERITEGVISRILEDERIGELLPKKSIKTEIKKKINSTSLYLNGILKITETSIPLKELLPENNKALSTVLKKHDSAKEYLQIVSILYEELSIDHEYFSFNEDGSWWEDKDQNMEILMRLECFMLTLMYKPTPAFIYYGSTGRYVRLESPSKLAKRLTNLGREFLFIWSIQKFIRNLDHDYLTRNIKILVEFFKNLYSNPREKATFNIQLDITLDSLRDLDRHLMTLKSYTESGRLHKKLASQQIYRTRDGDNEPELVIVRPNRIEFNELWRVNSKKWGDAIKYFRSRFRGKSVLLYRAEIRLHSNNGRVTAEQFQKFFGVFNKKANTPNGLLGYSEFLYFWKEDFSNKELVLDLVSIFEADTLLTRIESELEVTYHDRNICKELEVYLKNCLDQQRVLFNDNEVELKFGPTPVLLDPSYEFAPEFLIEVGEQKKWNIFENKIIPYFVFMGTLDLPYSDEIVKRFSRSQKRSS